jgi:hypothetical protein
MADAANAIATALPLRRRAQLKRVLNGEPIGRASLAVGYSSRFSGSEALADTRKRLLAAMDHYSLTPESVVRDYILPLLNATKTTYFAHKGIVTDERIEEDNAVRKDAVDQVCKIMGAYPKDNANGPSIGSVNIVWNGPAPAWAMPVTDRDNDIDMNSDNINELMVTDRVPVSAIEGTGSRPALSPHIHPAISLTAKMSSMEPRIDVPVNAHLGVPDPMVAVPVRRKRIKVKK